VEAEDSQGHSVSHYYHYQNCVADRTVVFGETPNKNKTLYFTS
jgi:hypothetical protein